MYVGFGREADFQQGASFKCSVLLLLHSTVDIESVLKSLLKLI